MSLSWRLRREDLLAPTVGSVGSRGLVSIAGLAGQGLIRFALTLLVGRIGGSPSLGLFATGLATAQLAVLLGPTTMGQAASRFIARARGRGHPAEVAAAIGHLTARLLLVLLPVALIGCVLVLVRGLGGFTLAGVVLLLTVGLAGQAFTRGVHYGCGQIRRVVILDVMTGLAALVGTAVMAWAGARGSSLLVPLTVSLLVLTVLCWPWGGGWGPVSREAPAERTGLEREIDRFVVFGALGSVASAGLIPLSLLAAAHSGDIHGAGQYAAALSLATPMTLLSGALSLVLYPTMSEALGRGDRRTVRDQLDRGTRGLAFVMVPAMAALALFSPELTSLIWGSKFDATSGLLPVVVLAVFLNVLGVPSVNALTSDRASGISMVSVASLVAVAGAAVVWALTQPGLGVAAAGVGYMSGTLLITGFAIARAWHDWGVSWEWLIIRITLAVMLVWGCLAWVSGRPDGLAWRLAAAAVIGLGWVVTGRRELRWWVSQLRRGRAGAQEVEH